MIRTSSQGDPEHTMPDDILVDLLSIIPRHPWWRARASWRMIQSSWDGSRLNMELAGQPCEGITLAAPTKFAEREVQSVHIGNDRVQWKQGVQNGRPVAFVTGARRGIGRSVHFGASGDG